MKWISFKDEVPNDGTKVLIYFDKSEHVESALIYDDGDGWYYVLYDGESLTTEPTHWMPFPKLNQEV